MNATPAIKAAIAAHGSSKAAAAALWAALRAALPPDKFELLLEVFVEMRKAAPQPHAPTAAALAAAVKRIEQHLGIEPEQPER